MPAFQVDKKTCDACPWRGLCLSDGPSTVLVALRKTNRAEDTPCKAGEQIHNLLKEIGDRFVKDARGEPSV